MGIWTLDSVHDRERCLDYRPVFGLVFNRPCGGSFLWFLGSDSGCDHAFFAEFLPFRVAQRKMIVDDGGRGGEL